MNSTDLIIDKLGGLGRMVWGEKYNLPKKLEGHRIIWNANLVVEGKKVWYGDIDLDGDAENLQAIANELKASLLVLTEHAGRFANEENPLVDEAVATFSPS